MPVESAGGSTWSRKEAKERQKQGFQNYLFPLDSILFDVVVQPTEHVRGKVIAFVDAAQVTWRKWHRTGNVAARKVDEKRDGKKAGNAKTTALSQHIRKG